MDAGLCFFMCFLHSTITSPVKSRSFFGTVLPKSVDKLYTPDEICRFNTCHATLQIGRSVLQFTRSLSPNPTGCSLPAALILVTWHCRLGIRFYSSRVHYHQTRPAVRYRLSVMPVWRKSTSRTKPHFRVTFPPGAPCKGKCGDVGKAICIFATQHTHTHTHTRYRGRGQPLAAQNNINLSPTANCLLYPPFFVSGLIWIVKRHVDDLHQYTGCLL